jgi:hypothetical protein
MDFPENQKEFNRRMEAEVARLSRAVEQELAKRIALVNRQQNPRLARTIEEFDENDDSTYPTEGSGANVFPIVFLSGGFTDLPGVQTPSYKARRETAQANVCSISGQWLPPDSVIEVWQDRGVEALKKGEWWTAARSCLPSQLVKDIRISGDQLIKDVWFSDKSCDSYVPYVIADLTDCYVPYTPTSPDMVEYFSDDFVLEEHPEWSISEDWQLSSLGAHTDNMGLFYPGGVAVTPAELTITIGTEGGFIQFLFTTTGSCGANVFLDGDEIVATQATGPGEWLTKGPYALDPGAHTISFAVVGTDGNCRYDDITVWGVE